MNRGYDMAYTVVTRTRSDKVVIDRTTFNTLEEAIAEADFAHFPGPRPVEVAVLDEAGIELSLRVFNSNP